MKSCCLKLAHGHFQIISKSLVTIIIPLAAVQSYLMKANKINHTVKKKNKKTWEKESVTKTGEEQEQ